MTENTLWTYLPGIWKIHQIIKLPIIREKFIIKRYNELYVIKIKKINEGMVNWYIHTKFNHYLMKIEN